MNSIQLSGRLVRDPELKYIQGSEKAVCNFTLAVNRRFQKDKADFINIQAWGKTAEICSKYLAKGSQCIISGSLNIDSYEKEGNKVWITKVVAENVEFIGAKVEKSEGNQEEFEEIDGDDIPF